MSKKHHQRTRAEILARRSHPSTLPAPVAWSAAGWRHIEGLRLTAATRRAMRSKY